jgi:hypothetical protein
MASVLKCKALEHKDSVVMSNPITTPLRGLSGTAAALLAGATVVATLGLDVGGAAAAEDLIVKYDQSQLLRLPRPASEIIIGNPLIADVAIQGGNLLVVTGKSFGITNIIILDSERNVIQDQRVMVERDVRKIVNLQRGSSRQSYNCAPLCNPTVSVGDDAKYFDSAVEQTTKKVRMSESGAEGGGAASGN